MTDFTPGYYLQYRRGDYQAAVVYLESLPSPKKGTEIVGPVSGPRSFVCWRILHEGLYYLVAADRMRPIAKQVIKELVPGSQYLGMKIYRNHALDDIAKDCKYPQLLKVEDADWRVMSVRGVAPKGNG